MNLRPIAFLLLLLVGCGDSSTTSVPQPADLQANNRGVGLMGSFDYDGAFQVFDALATVHPEWTPILINREIARLNRQQDQDEQTALRNLQSIVEETGDLRARYITGLLEFNNGDLPAALESFQTVVELDPVDAYAAYYLGQVLQQQGDSEAALALYERAMELDPYLRSAIYGASLATRRTGQPDRAAEFLELFQAMEDNPRARLAEVKYTRMGPKAMAVVVDQEVRESPAPMPAGSIFSAPVFVAEDVRFTTNASCTACDIDDDGDVDVFVTGVASGGNLLLVNEQGTLKAMRDHPLCAIEGVLAPLWGDLDDDGRLDAYLCRAGANQLWLQQDSGWIESTDAVVGDGAYDTVDGALFDADHDGDLDVFCVNANGPDALLNNNRNGSFTRVADDVFGGGGIGSKQVLVADLDRDRDVDLIVVGADGNRIYINDRLWNWRMAGAAFDVLSATPVHAAVAGDVEAMGRPALCTIGPDGMRWWQQADGDWSPTVLVDQAFAPNAGLALTDVTGDGSLDVIAGSDSGWSVWPAGSNTSLVDAAGDACLTWAPVLLTPQRGPAIVSVRQEGVCIDGAGPGRFDFVPLRFTGMTDAGQSMRSNASGVGTRVAARVGSRWTVTGTLRADAGPGQSLQPVALGLGGASAIDFIAIDWSDGVFQTELDLTGGDTTTIVETQRQLSSCPVIFTWNGSTMQFVSDCLGVAGVGFRADKDTVVEPRPWERFLLPVGALAARDGEWDVVLAEPMEEACYLDAMTIETWDLPPGWSMAIDERMGTGSPAPTGATLFYQRSVAPKRVSNVDGVDVTAESLDADGTPVDPGTLDHRFIGRVVAPHAVTIEFDDPIDFTVGSPVLLLDGWVEYPYSQTVFAAWQAGATYDPPTLLAEDAAGEWLEVLPGVGYPAGMPRQMALPLPALPEGCRRLRLESDLQLYWDRIQLIWSEPCESARRHESHPRSATVFAPGFPHRTTDSWFRPDYDWSKAVPFWDTRAQRGFYTSFEPGGATPLVAAPDRSVAIFGTGEAIRVIYPAVEDPLPEGWSRRHVLDLVGWCKDMDIANLQGETVGPLPGGDDSTGLNAALNTRYRSGW
jgi:tetratricopeptide (TPR) repeat protein